MNSNDLKKVSQLLRHFKNKETKKGSKIELNMSYINNLYTKELEKLEYIPIYSKKKVFNKMRKNPSIHQ